MKEARVKIFVRIQSNFSIAEGQDTNFFEMHLIVKKLQHITFLECSTEDNSKKMKKNESDFLFLFVDNRICFTFVLIKNDFLNH